jgi:hypothetical protein
VTADILKARLALVRKGLNEVLDHVSDDMLAWAPGEGMRTVAGQIVEIAGSEIQALAKLKDEPEITWEEAQALVGDASSLSYLRAKLLAVRAETLAHLETLSGSKLQEPTSQFLAWHEGLHLDAIPVGEVFTGIAMHENYHVGQLISYVWAKGDNPYKWK